jgi:hypothetical protein
MLAVRTQEIIAAMAITQPIRAGSAAVVLFSALYPA